MKKIKTAVLGVGHLGRHHARIYHELPQSELICIIDTNKEHAEKIGQGLGVPYYFRLEDLPSEVEAVSVATPTIYHWEIAKKLLEKKIHLLIEKPITTNAQDARELVQLARQRGCKIQVGHVERFNPLFAGMTSHIKNPQYIEANRAGPYSFRSTDVSVVHDVMIHDVDLVLHLIHSEVVEVDALGLSVLSTQEDLARVRLKFANGAMADITANRVSIKPVRQLRLFQDGCQITMDFMTRKGRIFRQAPDFSQEKIEAVDPVLDRERLSNLVFGPLIEMEEVSFEDKEPLKEELSSFLQAIIEDGPTAVPGEDGLRAMEMIERIGKSIVENRENFKGG